MTDTNIGANGPADAPGSDGSTRTESTPPPSTSSSANGYVEDRDRPEPTGWTGWLIFGGLVGLMLGIFHFFQGFIALLHDDYYLVAKSGLAIEFSYTTWGWIQIVIGVLMIASGAGLMVGQTWARVTTSIFVVVSAIISAAFLKAFPIWSALMIGLCVLVLWATIVHGREMKTYADRW
ncbi:hypothetical protein FB561_1134 [Kribbella amoyensis]|uniref:DUF7144 domain-containing protein n=1 Tax=Kribbella amoyensis TaxID=996641 RepID=A0A561BMQ2_9ACTN|nr:hypothetical protein [Kribbella amoyensis]TWD80062.1 hypothetical protein FB561_1134 [Kribbella amoyensis]